MYLFRARTAVLETTLLYFASEILSLYLNTDMLEYFMQDAAVQDWINANNELAGLVDNSTYLDPSMLQMTWSSRQELSLRNWHFPRQIVNILLMSTLQYHWMVYLERILPARPRDANTSAAVDFEDEDGTDVHEERIVRKWIAQGRVKRASLSWRNTLLKWMLELSFGRLWYHTIEHILSTLLSLQHPRSIIFELDSHLANNFLGAYTFSMAPLATLLAFAVVPVQQQIVFIAGADLLGTVFVTMLIRLLGAWVVKIRFVQQYFHDGAEDIRQEMLNAIGYNDALIDDSSLGFGSLRGKQEYDRGL